MNKFWAIVLLLLAVLVGVAFTVESVETIPDNAKIVVFPSRKAWLPDAKFVAHRLAIEYNDPSTAMQTASLMRELRETTYAEVRNGAYKGFVVLEGWREPQDDFTKGASVSIIRATISPPERRWNADGTWNPNWIWHQAFGV